MIYSAHISSLAPIINGIQKPVPGYTVGYVGNPGETDHPKPEQTDHLKGWRRLPNFAGEDFQFCADFML